ncbi:MAG: cytochrome c [Ardenticatenaceae bacterium]|nr:cytochrome c [Ardenticatenaceae bacterium]
MGNWLGWGLIGVGLGVTLLSFWLRRQREFVALSVLVLAIGILLLVTGGLQALDLTALSGAAASTTNPVPPTDASIARGRVLYGQHCAACHGATGRGDGPAAAGLNPGPADLQVHVPLHTDAAIFDWITNGIPGSAMLAQGEAIRPEDRWNIINYLRVLVSSPTGRGE